MNEKKPSDFNAEGEFVVRSEEVSSQRLSKGLRVPTSKKRSLKLNEHFARGAHRSADAPR